MVRRTSVVRLVMETLVWQKIPCLREELYIQLVITYHILKQEKKNRIWEVPRREKTSRILFCSPSFVVCCWMRERWIALPGDNGTSSRTTFDDRGTKHVTLVVRDSCTHSHRHRQLMGAVKSPGFQSNWAFLLCLVQQPRPTWRQTAAKWYHQSILCLYMLLLLPTRTTCSSARRQSNSTRKTIENIWSRVFFSNYQNLRRHYRNILNMFSFYFIWV